MIVPTNLLVFGSKWVAQLTVNLVLFILSEHITLTFADGSLQESCESVS